MDVNKKQKIAATVLDFVNKLNNELRYAFNEGLKVHLSPEHSWPERKSVKHPHAFVFLSLKIEDGEVLAENVNPRYIKTPWQICEHSFGQTIAWQAGTDPLQADVYEECSRCGTKRFYVYPDGSGD